MKKIAVIPVYKDTNNIVKVLAKLNDKKVIDEICLVIDGASEKELHTIEKIIGRHDTPVHLLLNKDRKGIGYAIKRGIKYSRDRHYDIVVVMAGNNKDDPMEIPRLLKPILEEDYDYVQGSRFLPGGRHVKTPILRGVFSFIFPFIWTFLTKIRCTDVTNGFRAYRVSIFDDNRINIWQKWLDGYELEYYIHYKVLTLNYKTKEVPISKVYPYRHKGGYSKIVPFRDWQQIIGPLVYLKLGIRK